LSIGLFKFPGAFGERAAPYLQAPETSKNGEAPEHSRLGRPRCRWRYEGRQASGNDGASCDHVAAPQCREELLRRKLQLPSARSSGASPRQRASRRPIACSACGLRNAKRRLERTDAPADEISWKVG
jgi:hypothetical protein